MIWRRKIIGMDPDNADPWHLGADRGDLFHCSMDLELALDLDPALYISCFQSCQQKKVFSSKFFCLLLWNWRYIYMSVKYYKFIKKATRTGPGCRELTQSCLQPPAAGRVEGDREPQNNSDPRVRNLRWFFGLLPWVYTSFYPRYSRGRAFSISWTNLQFLGVIAF